MRVALVSGHRTEVTKADPCTELCGKLAQDHWEESPKYLKSPAPTLKKSTILFFKGTDSRAVGMELTAALPKTTHETFNLLRE